MLPDIKRILYATDLSENSRHAFAYAVTLAQRFDAAITLFHVIEDFSPSSTARLIDYLGEQGLADIQKRRAAEFIQTVKERMTAFCQDMGEDTPECQLRVDEMEAGNGYAAEEILRLAATGRFDIIVMGTKGAGGLTEAIMGNTARRVVRRSPVPVFTVRLP